MHAIGEMERAHEAVAYLNAVVPAMRSLGVTEFDGLRLGPPPSQPDGADGSERKLTTDEIERRSRAERQRIALAASGGPVKRILDPTRP